jgi:hypothetical protein
MKKIFCSLIFMSVSVLICGCAALPIKQEIPLPPQVIGQPPSKEGMVRLVIFNNSDFLLYGLDTSGRINVSIDGKGVGQLNIGRYVVVEISEGEHAIDLVRRDIADFHSSHLVDIKEPESYLKIYSKITSNGAELVEKPADFDDKFTAEYWRSYEKSN